MEASEPTALEQLDGWLTRTWTSFPKPYQWLVLQTIATHQTRREWIQSWPDLPGPLVFDLGCGPGIVALEIARLKSCHVVGWDKDVEALQLAQQISRLFDAEDLVSFRLGNLFDEYHGPRADAACVRFVAQYAEDATEFLSRVKDRVAPGGYIAIEDVDDGWTIEYPDPPAPWQKAVAAFQAWQRGASGDRMVGRKLAEAGVKAGLALESLSLNPSVSAGILHPGDLSVSFDIERITQALPDMVRAGVLDESEWTQAKAAYRDSLPRFVFLSTATIRLVFRVPVK